MQANELLLSGRKLTAQEACSKGLVSQVLWPGTFTQEVMLRIKELVAVDAAVSHSPELLAHLGSGAGSNLAAVCRCCRSPKPW